MIFKLRLKIRIWLFILVFISLGPISAFCVYIIHELGDFQKHREALALTQQATVAAGAVEQRLALALGSLTALAESDAARHGDLAALYQHAQRLLPGAPHVMAITLIGPDGAQVFNTLKPFGAANPPTGASARRVFDTGQPTVSGPFTGSISNTSVIAVGAPVFVDGRVAYCLRMVIKTDAFNDLLAGQKLDSRGISQIVNGAGAIVARTRDPAAHIGQPVSPAVLQAIQARRADVFPAVTRDGEAVQAAVARIPAWDWAVMVSVATDVIDVSTVRALNAFAFAAALFLSCSVAAAVWLAQLISRHVAALSAATTALRDGGGLPSVQPTGIRELDELGAALGAVDEREQVREVALLTEVAAHQQIRVELTQARCDGLTGLLGRALFLENVLKLRDDLAGGSQAMALLFVDLDGFKAVNDTLGHDRGDAVLMRTADILRHAVRGADVIGRVGGDEFVVCLVTSADAIYGVAQAVADRLVAQVAGIGDGIGCSVGVAHWTADCPDLPTLMKQADGAMYAAKRLGKNRVVVHGDEI